MATAAKGSPSRSGDAAGVDPRQVIQASDYRDLSASGIERVNGPVPDIEPDEPADPRDAQRALDALIAALFRERESYDRYDRAERVAMVDAELERLGAKPPAAKRRRASKAAD